MSSPITQYTFLLLLLPFLLSLTNAAQFNIVNRCPYTVWGAASPGGGRQLNQGDTWVINVNPGTTGARIWARTGCNFDPSGNGGCQTGDCGGVLSCTGYGKPPATLAEYALNGYANNDYYDISLIEGFNVPMDFQPTSNCRDLRCTADINGQCPGQLRTAGGCNNPGDDSSASFFKQLCPDAYSKPNDVSTNACPSGTNYNVVFCP